MKSGRRPRTAIRSIVVDASRDNSKQQSQVEDFISQKVAAIVLTPYDSQAIGSAIAEANKAGIPVFTADIANASKPRPRSQSAYREQQRAGRRTGCQTDVRRDRQERAEASRSSTSPK